MKTSEDLVQLAKRVNIGSINWLEIFFILLILFGITLFVTQSWKAEAGFPMARGFDLPSHSYKIWQTAEHLRNFNFGFDFDYKTNSLFLRNYPPLAYFVGAPFIIFFGLWQGISYFVIFCYFLLGLGGYFLGSALNLRKSSSLILSFSILLSYGLVWEAQINGSLTRLFAYALLPFVIICYLKKENNLAKIGLPILTAAVLFSHPLTALHLVLAISLLFLNDIITKAKNTDLKSIFAILKNYFLYGLFTLAITAPIFGSVLLEQSQGVLYNAYNNYHAPLYAENLQKLPGAFFDRTLTIVTSNDANENLLINTSGYLGISLIILTLIGLITSNNKNKNSFFLIFSVFTLIALFHNHLPYLLTFMHYSRAIFVLSFFIAILSAFGIDSIINLAKEKTKNVNLLTFIEIAMTFIIALIIIIDLAPGVTAIPDGNYNQPQVKAIFSSYNTVNRVFFVRPILSWGWITYSKADFLQHYVEQINPEYSIFMQKDLSSLKFRKAMDLLNIETVLTLEQGMRIIPITVIPLSRAYAPSQTIFIENKTPKQSQETFEYIINHEENYLPIKTGFLLSRGEIKTDNVDFVLVSKKTGKSKEITLNELQALFNSTASGKTLPWGKSTNGDLSVLVDSPGWVFVSQMWYPHFRVNDKPLQEAGGGLMAFYADAPGTYKIYWERPWYDYVFWTISIATLLFLIYLALNPKRHEELTKLP